HSRSSGSRPGGHCFLQRTLPPLLLEGNPKRQLPRARGAQDKASGSTGPVGSIGSGRSIQRAHGCVQRPSELVVWQVVIRDVEKVEPFECRLDRNSFATELERARDTNVGSDERIEAHLAVRRSEEHTSELQSLAYLVCRL